jgi:hypothetical protein
MIPALPRGVRGVLPGDCDKVRNASVRLVPAEDPKQGTLMGGMQGE